MSAKYARGLAGMALILLNACGPAQPAATTTPTLPPATATQHAINLANLRVPKDDGTYLIDVHMARGVWHTEGMPGGGECYWLTRHADGIILQSYLGAPIEQVVNFGSYDYEFSTTGCGVWTFLGTPTPTPTPTATPTSQPDS